MKKAIKQEPLPVELGKFADDFALRKLSQRLSIQIPKGAFESVLEYWKQVCALETTSTKLPRKGIRSTTGGLR
jgi:hypothetical protein